MNHLKKIEDRVISILKTNVDARSDDMMLYLLVCNSFYSNENSVGKMPFEVVMKNYKELELPHFESVRRTRAKIQSEHPELACSPECRKARKRMQHLYSNYVMEPPHNSTIPTKRKRLTPIKGQTPPQNAFAATLI